MTTQKEYICQLGTGSRVLIHQCLAENRLWNKGHSYCKIIKIILKQKLKFTLIHQLTISFECPAYFETKDIHLSCDKGKNYGI